MLGNQEDDLYTDPTAQDYKTALGKEVEEQYEGRYGHPSRKQFEQLKELILEYSDCMAVDGLQLAVVKGVKFDIELEAGAQPVRATLPKLSPGETQKEHYHIDKEERLGHLRTPTDDQKSEWATRTHTSPLGVALFLVHL